MFSHFLFNTNRNFSGLSGSAGKTREVANASAHEHPHTNTPKCTQITNVIPLPQQLVQPNKNDAILSWHPRLNPLRPMRDLLVRRPWRHSIALCLLLWHLSFFYYLGNLPGPYFAWNLIISYLINITFDIFFGCCMSFHDDPYFISAWKSRKPYTKYHVSHYIYHFIPVIKRILIRLKLKNIIKLFFIWK